MTRAPGIFHHRWQGADSANHAKLCNPFLPDGDLAGRGQRAESRQPSAAEGS
jgi:hypothetical protein